MPARRAARSHPLPGALLAACLATLLVACGSPQPPFHATEVSGIDYGRGIRIADTEARLRSLEDYRGDVALVFFGFVSCPDVCPTTLMRLKQARDALGPDAARVKVVLVSVDPERDTPELLRAYVRNFGPGFEALRPEPAELQAVTRAFHAVAVRTPPTGDSYTIDHSAVIYAYDRGNRLRLVIQPDFKLPELTADLRRLVAE